MTAKEIETIIPDPSARQNALNFLLGVGLLKTLVNANRKVSFRAVTKGELVVTKDLNGEENLVLGHIKAAGNEGIWTKHLKTKTNLHQTVIDRCLKTLTQKRLVKRVPSVQHPTRKIYMLEGLEPSIALTGGPWYTDNELDTEFIQHLTDACYKFIRDLTFPKRKEGIEGALYAISNPPKYPSAQHIRNSLKKARLTETELSVEHVEMLLNVLVLDGKIEKLPAFGLSVWDSLAADDGESAPEEDKKKRRKKRKHDSTDSEEDDKRSRRKKRRDTDDGSSSEDETTKSKSKKRGKKKKNDDDDDSDPDFESRQKRRKKKVETDSGTDESSDEEPKRKKRKKFQLSDSSESDEDKGDNDRNRRSSKLRNRSSSSFAAGNYDDFDSGSVYRAIREERPSFGWPEAPCSLCPSFDFCQDGGPVNPKDCVYYGEWLIAGSLTTEESQT
ncbi:putative DNA-directed RNA polymerase III subunit rpc6 [Leucoagaricus sp. SymC.cos]|nr:putative DNA-directed RNA polymerase III subunit rpc6 [Leucoagaricus sp. SymC.cos]